MKKFVAAPSFWSLFPQAAIGVLTVRDVDEAAKLTGEQAAEVAALLKSANAAAMGYLEKNAPALPEPGGSRLAGGLPEISHQERGALLH